MLEHILNSGNNVRILKFLVSRPEWVFIEAEIARELAIPKASAHRALKSLRDQNVLRQIKKGKRVSIYQLNESNYLVKDLIKPFLAADNTIVLKKTREFCRRIVKFSKVVILFGSAQKGTIKPTSDIDVAVISDKRGIENHINKIKTRFLKKEGLLFSTHVYTLKEFRKKYIQRNPIVLDISNGKVLYGDVDDVV